MFGLTCAVLLHTLSWHPAPGYNNDTIGAGIECARGDYVVAAGQFQNSEDRPSQYIVGGKYLTDVGPVRLGVLAGAISGYARYGSGYGPALAGLAAYQITEKVGVRILVTPPAGGVAMAVHAALAINF